MGGGYDTDPVWSPDGSKICWISMERDGYEADKQRLMVADLNYPEDGSLPGVSRIRELTGNFKYNVAAPVWDEDGKTIYFNALTEGLQALYQVNVDEQQIKRLTPENQWNDYDSPFYIEKDGEDGKRLYSTWCSLTAPSEIVVTRVLLNEFQGTTPITRENEWISSALKPVRTEDRVLFPAPFGPITA